MKDFLIVIIGIAIVGVILARAFKSAYGRWPWQSESDPPVTRPGSGGPTRPAK